MAIAKANAEKLVRMAEISRKQQIEMSAKFHCSILSQLELSVSDAGRAGNLALVCLKGYGLVPVLGGSCWDEAAQMYDTEAASVIVYDRSHNKRREFVFDLLLECLSVDENGEPVAAFATDQVQRYRITESGAQFTSSEGLANGRLSLNDYMEFDALVSRTYFGAEETAGAVALLYADGRVGEVDDYMSSFVDLSSLGRESAQGFLDI